MGNTNLVEELMKRHHIRTQFGKPKIGELEFQPMARPFASKPRMSPLSTGMGKMPSVDTDKLKLGL